MSLCAKHISLGNVAISESARASGGKLFSPFHPATNRTLYLGGNLGDALVRLPRSLPANGPPTTAHNRPRRITLTPGEETVQVTIEIELTDSYSQFLLVNSARHRSAQPSGSPGGLVLRSGDFWKDSKYISITENTFCSPPPWTVAPTTVVTITAAAFLPARHCATIFAPMLSCPIPPALLWIRPKARASPRSSIFLGCASLVAKIRNNSRHRASIEIEWRGTGMPRTPVGGLR